jgi:hypothetical protein
MLIYAYTHITGLLTVKKQWGGEILYTPSAGKEGKEKCAVSGR